jgi:hypothetical protein
MSENYDRFREYLLPVLIEARSRRASTLEPHD